jgi:hypothetical protein
VGEITVEVPEGLPLNDLKKKILDLIEEETKRTTFKRSEEKINLSEKGFNRMESTNDQPQKEERKKILDKYYGIIKLDRPVSIEEILDLEEETWQY